MPSQPNPTLWRVTFDSVSQTGGNYRNDPAEFFVKEAEAVARYLELLAPEHEFFDASSTGKRKTKNPKLSRVSGWNEMLPGRTVSFGDPQPRVLLPDPSR
jgi:hypothetical protein